MTTDDGAIFWLTSGEHPNWAGPTPVTISATCDHAGREYVYLTRETRIARNDNKWMVLLATSRLDAMWTNPAGIKGTPISVWIADADLSAEPGRSNPHAWCTLYATETEARLLASKAQSAFERNSGW